MNLAALLPQNSAFSNLYKRPVIFDDLPRSRTLAVKLKSPLGNLSARQRKITAEQARGKKIAERRVVLSKLFGEFAARERFATILRSQEKPTLALKRTFLCRVASSAV